MVRWALKTSPDGSYLLSYPVMPSLVAPLALLFLFWGWKELRREYRVVYLEHAHLLAKWHLTPALAKQHWEVGVYLQLKSMQGLPLGHIWALTCI